MESETKTGDEVPCAKKTALLATCGVAISAALAAGLSAGFGLTEPVTGAAWAAAACALPAVLIFLANVVGLPVAGATAVVTLTFLRPLFGLAAVLVCDGSYPDARSSLIVGLACVYPTCLVLETLFLLRLTGVAPGSTVAPRSTTETHNDG